MDETTDERLQGMKPRYELAVRGQTRKSGSEIGGDDLIGVFESRKLLRNFASGNFEAALQKRDSWHLRVSKSGAAVGRSSPLPPFVVLGEEIIYCDEEDCHLMNDAVPLF